MTGPENKGAANADAHDKARQAFLALSDDDVKKLIRQASDDVIAKDLEHKLSEIEKNASESDKKGIADVRDMLRDPVKRAKVLAEHRESLVNDPETIKAWREGLANNKDAIDQAVHDAPGGVPTRESAAVSAMKFVKQNSVVPAFFAALDSGVTAAYVLGWRNRVFNWISLYSEVKNAAPAATNIAKTGGNVLKAAENAKGALNGGEGALGATEGVVEGVGKAGRFLKPCKVAPGVVYVTAALETGYGGYEIYDGLKNDNQHKVEEGSKDIGGGLGSLGGGILAGAAATALVGAPLLAVGAGVAIGVGGYYLGKNVGQAAYDIYYTEHLYSQIDATFQPDTKRCSNFVGAMARVLGNPAMNASLAQAGVPVDKKYGKVTMETLNAALTDPKEGPYAMGRLRALITQLKSGFEKTMKDNDTWCPRWICFTDNQANKRMAYENAKMDARIMNSGLIEADSYVASLKQRKEEARQKAEAERAKAEGTVQSGLKTAYATYKTNGGTMAEKEYTDAMDFYITASLKKNYEDYRKQNGENALEEPAYLMAGRMKAANSPDILARFQEAEKSISYITAHQLADWKSRNPSATAAQIDSQRNTLANQNRQMLIDNPQGLQQALARYQEEDKQKSVPVASSSTSTRRPAEDKYLFGLADRYLADSFDGARDGRPSMNLKPVANRPQPELSFAV